MSDLHIRDVRPHDRNAWATLFAEYREFCGRKPDAAVVDTAWEWLMDGSHEVRGLVAESNGAVVAIAHFRSFARTVDADRSLHLDDLFVSRAARGKGAARALISHLGEIAHREHCRFVRWVTAADNVSAQVLYDRIAHVPGWVTYEMNPDVAAAPHPLVHAEFGAQRSEPRGGHLVGALEPADQVRAVAEPAL